MSGGNKEQACQQHEGSASFPVAHIGRLLCSTVGPRCATHCQKPSSCIFRSRSRSLLAGHFLSSMSVEEDAACTMQRSFRCFRAKERYFEEIGLKMAATTIQCAWRCRNAREFIAPLCSLPRRVPSTRATSGNPSDACLAGNEYYETLGAQSARGSDGGARSEKIVVALPAEAHAPVMDTIGAEDGTLNTSSQREAAMMIQRAMRCHHARLSYYMLLGIEDEFGCITPPDSAGEPGRTTDASSVGPPPDRTVAAMIIQCSFRCSLARNFYYELLASTPESPHGQVHTWTKHGEDAVPPAAVSEMSSLSCDQMLPLEKEPAIADLVGDAASTIQRSFRCFSGKQLIFFNSLPSTTTANR